MFGNGGPGMDFVREAGTRKPNPEEAIASWAKVETLLKDETANGVQWSNPEARAKYIELPQPLLRPYGCGPIAPGAWWCLKTYPRILELRDESRMGPQMEALGDRTFKRAYIRGLKQLTTSGSDKVKVVKSAFQRIIGYPYWHLYMFPFGVTMLKTLNAHGTEGNQTLSNYIKNLQEWEHTQKAERQGSVTLCGRGFIQPFAAAAADILYLCNTSGYLERYVYTLGIVLWCKRQGVNVLQYEKASGSKHLGSAKSSAGRMLLTRERYMYLFGSIVAHRRVMETNRYDVGGNWLEYLDMLQRLENELVDAFGIDRYTMSSVTGKLIMENADTFGCDINTLKQHFPQAAKLSLKSK